MCQRCFYSKHSIKCMYFSQMAWNWKNVCCSLSILWILFYRINKIKIVRSLKKFGYGHLKIILVEGMKNKSVLFLSPVFLIIQNFIMRPLKCFVFSSSIPWFAVLLWGHKKPHGCKNCVNWGYLVVLKGRKIEL